MSANLQVSRRSFLQHTRAATTFAASSPALFADASRIKPSAQTFCAFEKPLQFLSADELAELEAGLAEADRGETISGEELFKQLRRHG